MPDAVDKLITEVHPHDGTQFTAVQRHQDQ